MLALDEVDGLVSGAVHTTANTVRPALQLIRTAPGASIVSSIFFMLMPIKSWFTGIARLILILTRDSSQILLFSRRIPHRPLALNHVLQCLSYSTGTSGQGDDVEKVREATELARTRRPDIMIDGPMQYDAASVESVARSKAPDSPVAGRATVFIFPDLNTEYHLQGGSALSGCCRCWPDASGPQNR